LYHNRKKKERKKEKYLKKVKDFSNMVERNENKYQKRGENK